MTKEILDLMQYKYGVKKINRSINISPTDRMPQAYMKIACFIYQSGEDSDSWTDDDLIAAVKFMENVESDFESSDIQIENIPITKFAVDEIDALKRKYKFGSPKWQDCIYQTTIFDKSGGKHESVYIVDPFCTSVTNNNKGGRWVYPGLSWFTRGKSFRIFNQDLLIGYYKLGTDLLKNCIPLDDDEHYQSRLHKLVRYLSDSRYRSKKYRYIFEKRGNAEEVERVWNEQKFVSSKDINENQDFELGLGHKLYRLGLIDVHYNTKVLDVIEDYLKHTYNLILQESYEDDLNRTTHAKFFQQKKNIKEATKAEMDKLSKSYADELSGVEIDNDVNLINLDLLQPQLSAVLKVLPKSLDKSVKPILRLRKLQNHHALGMFTPVNNTVAIDFRVLDKEDEEARTIGTFSFIHEYGHFLDFRYDSKMLSLSKSYAPILNAVQHKLNIMYDDPNGKFAITKKDLKYLSTPTEIFARSFELYCSNIGLNNQLIDDKNRYSYGIKVEYTCFDPKVREAVNKYFDNLFGIEADGFKAQLKALIENTDINGQINLSKEK